MADWMRIRRERGDLTDYVVHLTKPSGELSARDVLALILASGHIRPTFAPMGNRQSRKPRNTIKGPHPAVCLSDQPLWAILKTRDILPTRYSGYGIAYHKYHLYKAGGRPVLYGYYGELGRILNKGEPGWEEDKEIFTGGLPFDQQYLWVNYYPHAPWDNEPSVDFTWEREWRYKPKGEGLPVILNEDQPCDPKGAILVERDADVESVQEYIHYLRSRDYRWERWAYWEHRIASLETVRRMLEHGDRRYGKLDTWPFRSPQF